MAISRTKIDEKHGGQQIAMSNILTPHGQTLRSDDSQHRQPRYVHNNLGNALVWPPWHGGCHFCVTSRPRVWHSSDSWKRPVEVSVFLP